MSAATIAAPPAERWHVVKDALSGWRTDDPDAYPRCSVNPEHQIRNGDHYAVSGIKMACLSCAGAPAPIAPRQQPTIHQPQRAATPAAPQAQTPATAPETPPAPRVALGPSHPDYNKPDTRETRQCARVGCLRTFTVRSDQSHQRFCTLSCSARSRQQHAAPKPKTEPKPKRVAWREERVCPTCQRTFMVTSGSRGQRYCSPSCSAYARHGTRPAQAPVATEMAAPDLPAAPAEHDIATCRNLCCADRRRAAGMAPLAVRIGGRVFPVLWSEGRAPAAVREASA